MFEGKVLDVALFVGECGPCGRRRVCAAIGMPVASEEEEADGLSLTAENIECAFVCAECLAGIADMMKQL